MAEKVHKLSDLINDIKKKSLSKINVNGYITLLNNIKHKDKIFLLERTPETVTYI